MDQVLIAGAGPTGLALALWLTRQGVKVRIVDQSAGPGETSRAMVVQARTLELYRQLDLADAVLAAGHRNPSMNVWARGKHRARIVLSEAGKTLSPYPFVTVYPQDQHERLLVDKLASLGVAVERKTELLDFAERDGSVHARLRRADGSTEEIAVPYLAGCDGARSTVRQHLGIDFEGGTYQHAFYVADVEASGLEPAGEAHIAFEKGGDFALVFPYGPGGTGKSRRLIGTVSDERAAGVESLTFEDVRQDALHSLGMQVERVNWFSTYRVHHRIASRFQRGRVFLLGDAGHIHSPVGGQGMNTGIVDASNLAWKLADVLHGRAPERLLESYALERQAFARTLVATTDRMFTLATSDGNVADFIKTHILPTIASAAARIGDVRELAFRTVSQITMHYRDSWLSRGQAGEVRGGERLPWLTPPHEDNFVADGPIGWQLHVYGQASADVRAWCHAHGIRLRQFAWSEGCRAVGLSEDALYLLRPDSYVALASLDATPQALARYFEEQGYAWEHAESAAG